MHEVRRLPDRTYPSLFTLEAPQSNWYGRPGPGKPRDVSREAFCPKDRRCELAEEPGLVAESVQGQRGMERRTGCDEKPSFTRPPTAVLQSLQDVRYVQSRRCDSSGRSGPLGPSRRRGFWDVEAAPGGVVRITSWVWDVSGRIAQEPRLDAESVRGQRGTEHRTDCRERPVV
jgi:hypothetical protein